MEGGGPVPVPVQLGDNKVQVPSDKWSVAAKVSLVAAAVIAVIALTFVALHFTHKMDAWEFITKKVPDFLRDPHAHPLETWELAALGTIGVAGLAGLIAAVATSSWLWGKIQTCRAQSKEQKVAAAKEKAEQEAIIARERAEQEAARQHAEAERERAEQQRLLEVAAAARERAEQEAIVARERAEQEAAWHQAEVERERTRNEAAAKIQKIKSKKTRAAKIKRQEAAAVRAQEAAEAAAKAAMEAKAAAAWAEFVDKLTPKLVAFIHGDSFIKGSDYEGGNVVRNITFLLPHLRQLEEPKLRNIESLLQDLCERSERHNLSRVFDSRNLFSAIRSYAEEYSQKVRDLKPGERFIMQGGWASKDGGHAMLYIVEREKDGNYAFSVINTGAGITSHSSQVKGYKTKYKPIFRLHNVAKDKMANDDFFASLLELQLSTGLDGEELHHSAESVYNKLAILGGERDYAYEDQIDFITAQKSGTCSWKVLMKLLHIELGTEAYKKLVFDLKEKSLKAFLEKKPQQLEEQRLLLLSSEGFARYSLRQHEKGLLTNDDLSRAERLSTSVATWVQKQESERVGGRAAQQFLHLGQGYLKYSKEDKGVAELSPTPPQGLVMARTRLLGSPIKSNTFPDSAEEMSDLLIKVSQYCEELSAKGNHAAVIQIITDFIKCTPPGSLTELGYWHKCCAGVDPRLVTTIMERYVNLSQRLFDSICGLPENQRDSPEQMVLMSMLVATNLRLATILGEPWRFPQEEMLNDWRDNPFAIIHDPALNATFDELKDFFVSIQPFFLETCLGLRRMREGFAIEFYEAGNLIDGWAEEVKKLQALVDREAANDPNLADKSDFEKFRAILPSLVDPKRGTPFSLLFQQIGPLLYMRKNPGLKQVSRKEGILSGEVRPKVVQRGQHLVIEMDMEGVNSYKDTASQINRYANSNTPILQRGYNTLFNGGVYKVGYARKNEWHTIWYCEKQENLSSYDAQTINSLFFKKDTVFPHLLSYLQENPDKLTDRDFQLMVHNSLYYDHLLRDNRQLFPEIRVKLLEHLHKQLEMYQISGDIETQLFIIELMTILSSREEFDAKRELHEIIKRIDTSTLSGQKLKSLALTQIITHYYDKERLTDEEIIEISVAYLHIRTYGYDEHFSYPSVKDKIEEMIDRITSTLRIPALQQEISTRAIQELFPKINDAERARYRIDLNDFVIFDGDLPLGGIPTTFTANADFQSLFGARSIAAREVGPGAYSFMLEGKHYRIFQSPQNKVIIQREEVGGIWTTFLSQENVRNHILEGLVVGHEHWISASDDQHFIIKIEKQGKPIAAMIGEVRQGGKWYIRSCTRASVGAAAQGLQLNHPSGMIAHFQKEGFFLNWDNTIFEFPKAQISFTLDNGKAYFSEDNRLFLAQVQKAPSSLSEYKGAIKLEDGKGKVSFLFPREPISLPKLGNKALQGALHRQISVDHVKNDGAYFHIEEREGLLVGSSIEENLFLAYLYLSHKNYKEAYRLLAPYAASHPRGYLEKEKEMIAWIFTMIDQAEDPSPAACAVHLQLLYLCQRNLPQEEKYKHNLDERIAKTLHRYYPMSHHMKTLAPSPIQEIELLEAVKGVHTPSVEARYRYLINVAKKKELALGEEEIIASLPAKRDRPARIDLAAWVKEWDAIPPAPLNRMDQARKADFNFYGKDRLKSFFSWQYGKDPIEHCLTDDHKARERMITALSFLQFKDGGEIVKMRDLLVFIATHATPEQRSELRNSLPQGKIKPKLQVLQDFAERIIEPREEEEKGLEAKPPREVVAERKPEVTPGFQPTYPQHIARSVANILEEDEEMQPEKIPELVPVDERLLDSLTPPANGNRVMQKEYTRVQDSVRQYRQELGAKTEWEFTPKQMQDLRAFVGERKEKIKNYAKGVQEEILALANRPPEAPIVALREGLEHLGKQREMLSLDQLIIFYLQNNGEELAKRNPHLTKEEREHIANLLQSYMLDMTEVSYLARLENDILEALQNPGEENTARLAATLREERAYEDPVAHKVLLIFEYYTGFRLRKEQVDLIEDMQNAQSAAEKSNIIKQLIMGSGKSKIILPLLALLNSRGDNVPMIVVPDMLFETNIEDMRALLGERFHHLTHTVELEDGEILTDAKLDEILDTVANIKANRSYALLKASTVGGLLLQFKKAAVELGAEDPLSSETIRKFEKLREILNTLFEDAIFDEADMILDYVKEMNFAIGRFQGMQEETVEIMEKIFAYIADGPLSHFFQLQIESEEPFNEATYEREVKPQLADEVMRMLGIDPAQEGVKEYLLTQSKQIPEFVQNATPKIRRQLALSKKMLSTFLPHIVGKNCNQHFGLSQKDSTFRAIPYDEKTKTPREKSEFSSPFMTMLYTTFYYARKGVTVPQIKKLMEECREQARTEYNAREGEISIKETQGYLRFAAFASLCGEDLFSIQEGNLQTVVDEFNKDIKRRIAFSKDFGWREIGFYDQQLTSGMQHLSWLFKSIMGFTGTLWNADTFPTKLTPETDPVTDGKTLQLLHASKAEVHTLDVDGLYASLRDGRYHACIDVGAWFRGQSERDVALRMLENLPEKFKAVIYFNDVDIPPGTKGQAVVVERGKEKEEPKLLSKCRIPMEDRFTYYSKTTGADIAQHPHAKAITTIGKNMLLRDLLQGVWRLRELDKKQSTDFAISPELKATMPHQGTLEDIFCLGINNQAIRQSSDNLGSLKKQIDFEGEAVVLNALKDPAFPIEEAALLSRASAHILAPTISMDPYELFGAVEGEEDTDKIIAATVASTKQKMSAVYHNYPALEARRSENTLETSINELVATKKDTLPERGRLEGEDPGMQMQVQQQAQMAQQMQMQMQMQLEVVQELQEGRIMPRTIHAWKYGNIFSSEYWEDEGRDVFTVNRVLRLESSGVKLQAPIFADGLSLTGSFAPLPPAILFQRGTLPVFTCALMYSEDNIRLVFLEPNAAEFLAGILRDEKKYRSNPEKAEDSVFNQPKNFTLLLVDPRTGIVQQGADEIPEARLLADPRYVQLCVQAKFYNGDLNSYTKNEMRVLEEWIIEKGVDQMRMLLSHILRARPNDREHFKDSKLGRLFTKLSQVPAK